MRKVKLFLINSFAMTATSLILRIIGVSFNVYISNTIGLAGMGLIEIIMSVFSFSVIVASSGINLGATRLVAEELACKSHSGIRKSMSNCLIYSAVFGIFAGLVLFLGADFIGTTLLGDERTVKSLPILAISLPFYSAQCVMYGYFTAVRKSFLTSIVQVFEMGSRIGLTVYFLEKNLHLGLEYACIGLMTAATLSEIIAFSLMFIVYLLDKRKYSKKDKTNNNITKRMFKITLPVAFSSYVCSALQTIKSIMIPLGLIKFGLTRDEALAQFGVISGMVIPVILFPAAFLSTFSSLIVPEITEAYRLDNKARINSMISRVFQISLIFTICVIGIFLNFSNEFGLVIYNNISIGVYIKILTPLALIAYLDGIVDAMLKGLNEQVSSMFFNIFDSAFSIALVYFLLPKFGLDGLLFVMFASKLLNTYLSIDKIARTTDFYIKYFDWIVKPFICIFASVIFSKLIVNVLSSGYKYTPIILIQYVLFSILLYIIFIMLFGSISKKDLHLLKGLFKK